MVDKTHQPKEIKKLVLEYYRCFRNTSHTMKVEKGKMSMTGIACQINAYALEAGVKMPRKLTRAAVAGMVHRARLRKRNMPPPLMVKQHFIPRPHNYPAWHEYSNAR